jgi:hypothetical protein
MPDRPIPERKKILKTEEEADKKFEGELKGLLGNLDLENKRRKEDRTWASYLAPQFDLDKLEEIIREIRENNKVSSEQKALINEYKQRTNLDFLKKEIDDVINSAVNLSSVKSIENYSIAGMTSYQILSLINEKNITGSFVAPGTNVTLIIVTSSNETFYVQKDILMAFQCKPCFH